MDLTFTAEQSAVADLAATILGDTCSPEQLRAAERNGGPSWSRDAWQKLADADLLGIGLPEGVGGGGYGFCEVALVVEAVARVAAPLPAYATLVLGAAPIARFGSPAQQARWLPGVIDGSSLLTGLLVGANDRPAVEVPPLVARATEEGLRVDGAAWYVPHAGDADDFVAPVLLPDGDRVLAVLDAASAGIELDELSPMSGEPQAVVHVDGALLPDDAILTGSTGIDGGAVRWLHQRAVAATCVAQVGTCAGALALTASYVSTREQFGAKLATFQGVSQRAADAYIDTELVRLTAWTAAWRLASDVEATDELAVAKHFTAEAGQRVVAAAQHLHGGIGMDLDYPVHRYFRWAKDHEQRLGSGAEHLAALGASIADREA
jgi:alkylation response protein AidB-like acyl-CoA dehydrogenase